MPENLVTVRSGNATSLEIGGYEYFFGGWSVAAVAPQRDAGPVITIEWEDMHQDHYREMAEKLLDSGAHLVDVPRRLSQKVNDDQVHSMNIHLPDGYHVHIKDQKVAGVYTIKNVGLVVLDDTSFSGLVVNRDIKTEEFKDISHSKQNHYHYGVAKVLADNRIFWENDKKIISSAKGYASAFGDITFVLYFDIAREKLEMMLHDFERSHTVSVDRLV